MARPIPRRSFSCLVSVVLCAGGIYPEILVRKSSGRQRDLWIVLIALFRLVKAAALIVAGIGMLRLLHRDVAETVTRWIEALRLDPGNHYIHSVLSRVFRVTHAQLRALSAGSFLYAALFTTEGVGLLLRKHWAEYLTIVSTALFIPLEVWEVWQRFTWLRLAFLLINAAIVWYLIRRVQRGHR